MTKEEYLDEGTRLLTKVQEEAVKWFEQPYQPSMTELLYWFQSNFTENAQAMKDSDHASVPNQPNAYHIEGSVWAHTMMVCQNAQFDHKVVKIAAMLHDIGKPMARDVIPMNAKKPSMNGEERNGPTVELGAEGRGLKTHFRGHEGLSFWLAIDPLYELKRLGVINKSEMDLILKIVSLHGTLFNRIKDNKEFKPEEVIEMFSELEDYQKFVKQCRNDSLGRFFKSGAGSRTSSGELLGIELYGDEIYVELKKEDKVAKNAPFLHVMVGLPACGKSTFIKNTFHEEVVIVSKDEEVMLMGKELGIDDYTDVYKTLTKEQHDETYKRAIAKFNKAVKEKKVIVIDMTNMSKKSRRKWTSQAHGYNTKAWVFIAGAGLLATRNIMRSQNEGKHIPDFVYENMMKSFIVPTVGEFDFVEYVNQD